MSDILPTAENPQTIERRTQLRQQVLYSCVELEDDNGGIILDVSERGLAIEVARSLADNLFLQMRFQLLPSDAWVDTRVRIAWMSASRKTAGVEFVGLPHDAHVLIQDWMSSIVHASESEKQSAPVENDALRHSWANSQPENAASVSESETKESVVEGQSQRFTAKDPTGGRFGVAETRDAETVSERFGTETTMPASTENAGHLIGPPAALSYGKMKYGREIEGPERATRSRRSDLLMAAVALAALLLSSFLFLTLRRQTAGVNHQASGITGASKLPGLATNSMASPEKPSVDSKLSEARPCFALQVGAMIQKDNADALVMSLWQKNFPAFVARRGTDRFYRVIVGPYFDVDSTLRVRGELKKQGVDAIRIPWNPSAQR